MLERCQKDNTESVPVSIVRPRVAVEQHFPSLAPGKLGRETEKFRVGFPILTDKFLEMLGKHFLDLELRCERAWRLILV